MQDEFLHCVAIITFDPLFCEATPLGGGTHDLFWVCLLSMSLFRGGSDLVGGG